MVGQGPGRAIFGGRFAKHSASSVVALLVAFSVLAAAPGAALHGNTQPDVTVCGVVDNDRGWGIVDVTVQVTGRGFRSVDHVQPVPIVTDLLGRFSAKLYPDFYELVFLPPDAPGWGVPAYEADRRSVVAATTVNDACGPGTGKGIDLGEVTLASPRSSLVEITLSDLGTGLPIEGADALMQALGTYDTQPTQTRADGTARLTCPVGAVVSVHFSKHGYEADSTSLFPCVDATIDDALGIWREPVAITGTVTDDITLEGVSGATVLAVTDDLVVAGDNHYVLETTTDDDGDYRLDLPWGALYNVTLTRNGYNTTGPETLDVALADLGPGIDSDYLMSRLRFVFADTVRDVLDADLGAKVIFTGPAPLLQDTEINPVGDFAIELAQGSYDVNISSLDKNNRLCALDISEEGVSSVVPETCFILVNETQAAVFGTVLDARTLLPLPLATVTGVNGTAVTDSDGRFALETDPGEYEVVVNRTHFVDSSFDLDIGLDDVVTLDDATELDRDVVTVTLLVEDAAMATYENATVCYLFDPSPGGSGDEEGCLVTGPGGTVTTQIPWTTLSGGFLDAGGYDGNATRSSPAPLVDLQDCFADLDLDPAVVDPVFTCVVAPVPGLATILGPFVDLHTGLPVAGVSVEAQASPGEDACGAPYVCTGITDATGHAVLLLPAGRSVDVSADHDDYQAIPDAEGVDAGGVGYVEHGLFRDAHDVHLLLLDAHTGAPLEGGLAAAVPVPAGFVCAPEGGGFACEGTSDGGIVELTLPWGSFSTESEAGSYGVDHQVFERDVPFLGATGPMFTITAAQADAHAAPILRVLRGADDPITVTVRAHNGTNMTDVDVSVMTERPDDFTCDPLVHDSGPVGYPDCAGALVDAADAFVLPAGTTSQHAWTVEATTPGHFRETARHVHGGASVPFTMWPLAFDMIVDTRDMFSDDSVPFVEVCIKNMDQLVAATAPDLSERCEATDVPQPLVFEDVTWIREPGAADDTGDVFSVRAVGTFHFPTQTTTNAGPGAPLVEVDMVPIDPTVPDNPCFLFEGGECPDPEELVPDDPCELFEGGECPDPEDLVPEDPCTLLGPGGCPTPDDLVELVCEQAFGGRCPDPGDLIPQDPCAEIGGCPTPDDVVTLVCTTVFNGPCPDPQDLIPEDVCAEIGGCPTPEELVALLCTTLFEGPCPDPQDLVPEDPCAEIGGCPTPDDVVALVCQAAFSGPCPPPEDLIPDDPCDVAPCDADPCAVQHNLEVCAQPVQPGLRLDRVAARGGGGPQNGRWVVYPPVIGATPQVANNVPFVAAPDPAVARHDGTWTVVYTPFVAGLSFPLVVDAEYTLDGAAKKLTLRVPTDPMPVGNLLQPLYVWQFNLHTEESVSCQPNPAAQCGVGAGGLDPEAAERARFFVQGVGL